MNRFITIILAASLTCCSEAPQQYAEEECCGEDSLEHDTTYHSAVEELLELGDSAMEWMSDKNEQIEQIKRHDRLTIHKLEVMEDSLEIMSNKPCSKCLEMQEYAALMKDSVVINLIRRDSVIYRIQYVDSVIYRLDTNYVKNKSKWKKIKR